MVLGALWAVAALHQQDTNALPFGTFSIGQTNLPMVLPLTPGPFADSKAFVQAGPYRFRLLPDGSLGERYLTEGGWADLAAAYSSIKDQVAKAPVFTVKVFFHATVDIYEKGADGTIRARRSTIEPYNLQEAYYSLGQFKAMAEVAAHGQIQIKLDVTRDFAPQVRYLEAGKLTASQTGPLTVRLEDFGKADPLFGQGYIATALAPRINPDGGSPADLAVGGPFGSVIDFQAALSPGLSTGLIGSTPVTTVPYWFYSSALAKDSLPIELFEIWKSHIALKAQAAHWEGWGSGVAASGSQLPALPQVADFQLTPDEISLLTHPEVAKPRFSPQLDLARYGLGEAGSEQEAWTATRPDGTFLALRRGAWGLAEGKANLTPVGQGLGERDGLDVVKVFKVSGSPATAAEALGFPKPSLSSPAAPILPPPGDKLAIAPKPSADWTPKPADDKTEGSVWEVTRFGVNTRGSIPLIQGGFPVPMGTKSLTFKVKSKSDEAYALNFCDKSGEVLDSLVFHGDVVVPAEEQPPAAKIIRYYVPLDGEWQQVALNLADLKDANKVDSVWLGPPPYGKSYARATTVQETIWLTDIRVSNEIVDTAGYAAPPDQVAEAAKRDNAIMGPPSPGQAATLRADLASQNSLIQANAAAVFERVKDPTFVPDLAKLATSASTDGAFFAIRALAFQGTPEAQAALAQVLQIGRFDSNRHFAAMSFPADAPDSFLMPLNQLQISLYWPTRRECAADFKRLKAPNAPIFFSAMFGDADPTVRLQTTLDASLTDDVQERRLLYAAANDPSEWVRIAAREKLMASSKPAVRAEALKGVRDDSAYVRATLVTYLGGHPAPDVRPVLDLAVVDKSPAVRAAALSALGSLEGPVRPEEVQNTFTDTDYDVLAALAALGHAGKLTVPEATLANMKATGNPNLAEYAKGGH